MRQPIVFGKYLLLDRVSIGGMAEVFKAKYFGDVGFEKFLAIKRILPAMAEDEQFISMFIDEAKITGELSHPNIAQIYELGQLDTAHFIAMEYVWGKDVLQIQNRLRRVRKKMPPSMACYIVSKVCEGLDYAHQKTDEAGHPLHIVHRDVSPQNILVSFSGDVKIIDFGIAKARSRSVKTQAGVLKGKFGYMSPEQVYGLPLDQRSDIFSIGTLLYEMSTGKRLFTGETDFEILDKVRNAIVPVPSSVSPDIPPEVDRIILKALRKNADERYHWASDMLEDLTTFIMGQQPIFTSKILAKVLAELFAEEKSKEQSQLNEFRKIKKDEMDRIHKVNTASHREVVMSLLPLQAGSNVEEGDLLELQEALDEELDADAATVIGAPSFLITDERNMIAEEDFAGEVDRELSRGETEEDGETCVYGGVIPGVMAPVAQGYEPLPSEPTLVFNAAAGGMIQTQGAPAAGGAGGGPGMEVDQGPTVIFDAGLGGTVSAEAGAAEAEAPLPMIIFPSSTPPPVDPRAPKTGVVMDPRRPSLVKDILTGVLVAVVVITGLLVWRLISVGGGWFKDPAALVIKATPPQIVLVFVDDNFKGQMKPGKPFRLKDMAPEEHKVELRPPNGDAVIQMVTLTPGEEKEITITLGPASGAAPPPAEEKAEPKVEPISGDPAKK